MRRSIIDAAKLLQTRIGEFHLRFNTDSSADAAVERPDRQVVEERGLSDPCLPPQHDCVTASRSGAPYQLVQPLTLIRPAEQYYVLRGRVHG